MPAMQVSDMYNHNSWHPSMEVEAPWKGQTADLDGAPHSQDFQDSYEHAHFRDSIDSDALSKIDEEDGFPRVEHIGAIHIPRRTSLKTRIHNPFGPEEERPKSPQIINTPKSPRSPVTTSLRFRDAVTPPPIVPPTIQVSGPQHSNGYDEEATPRAVPEDYDLEAPPMEDDKEYFSSETLADMLYSREHLESVFADSTTMLDFTSYLSASRPQSIPILMYYLDATKALKAFSYANAVAENLGTLPGYDFTLVPAARTANPILQIKADQAFDVLVQEDLPAYVTYLYIQNIKGVMLQRVTSAAVPQTQEGPEGLAEVFCVSEPSRPDNPVVFVSEAFSQMTQYGMKYIIGRNCRFLQGPKTNQTSVRRLRKAVDEGREHCEVVLNYRRDGSPFMNLLMHAPLCDNSGKVRYFLGAQVDVSSLFKDGADMDSLRRVVERKRERRRSAMGVQSSAHDSEEKDEFKELSKLFDEKELYTVQNWGERVLKDSPQGDDQPSASKFKRPNVVLREPSSMSVDGERTSGANLRINGFYKYYLLIRPFPSLRILFASPSLRIPGMVQSPIMNKIGGSARIRDELMQALAEGRGVTARIKWISKTDEEGRNRWIHFTPLLRSDSQIGVWTAILVDEDEEGLKYGKQAPPVDANVGKPMPATTSRDEKTAAPNGLEIRQHSINPKYGHKPKISWSGPEVLPEHRNPTLNWRQNNLEDSMSEMSVNTSMTSVTNGENGEDEEFESLEERLRKKRQRDANKVLDQSGKPIRKTYKSLSPYAYLEEEAQGLA